MPATTLLTAGQVMDMAASLMNDTAKANYTYVNMLPYLKMALDYLQELFELNNVPVTNKTSATINCPAGTTALIPQPAIIVPGEVYYPTDLIEIQELWESPEGQDSWIPMVRRGYLPHYLDNIPTASFVWFSWENQRIKVLESTQDNDIKMDYIAALFTSVVDDTSAINIINSKSFLGYKTAALCAQYIASNPTRALSLENEGMEALDRTLGISTKGQQAILYRRRPFRSRRRSW